MTDKILFGGDYNPEQWPREVWDADHAAFDLAHIDTVTLGVFDWALTQPAEDTYDFALLDEIVEKNAGAGKKISWPPARARCRPGSRTATPRSAAPTSRAAATVYGQRHNACPSSPVFRRLSAALADQVARRYAGHPALVAWHVGNEYGGACYCDLCAEAFRAWLRDRYSTLDALNDAWNTTFWSHTFTAWDADRAAERADRALARPEPHRVPGHHAGLPAVHLRRDARELPSTRRRRSAATSLGDGSRRSRRGG